MEQEVLEWEETASKEELQMLETSGALDMLTMLCSGIRYELKHRVLFNYNDPENLINEDIAKHKVEMD